MGTTYLTTQDVARRLGLTRKGVQYLTNSGKLKPAQRVGSKQMNLYDAAEVEALAAERAKAGAQR